MSVTPILKPTRLRCEAHRRWVETLPCLVCMRRASVWSTLAGFVAKLFRFQSAVPVSQAHHLKFAQPRGRSIKSGDQHVVPLCVRHHGPGYPGCVEEAGREPEWWAGHELDPLPIAAELWAASVAAGRVNPKILKEAA